MIKLYPHELGVSVPQKGEKFLTPHLVGEVVPHSVGMVCPPLGELVRIHPYWVGAVAPCKRGQQVRCRRVLRHQGKAVRRIEEYLPFVISRS